LGIPVGAVVTNAVSSVSLLEAIRRGMPFSSQFKIVGNIFLNAGIGAIPIVGDLFSFVFRSNSRNRDVIQDYLDRSESAGKEPSWWRVWWSLVFVGFLGVAALAVSIAIYMLIGHHILDWLWNLLQTEVASPFSPGAE